MGVIIGCSLLIGAGICMSVWMIIEWRKSEIEQRVQTQEVIYLQAAILAHGIPVPHPPGNHPEQESVDKSKEKK